MATGSKKECLTIKTREEQNSAMIKVFTGVQFFCSVLFTLLIWFAPYFGLVEAGTPQMVQAMSMVDFMWLLTIIFVMLSLAKHEKEKIDDETGHSRNY